MSKEDLQEIVEEGPTERQTDIAAVGCLMFCYIVILLCLTIAAFVAQGAVFGFIVLAACFVPPMWMSSSYLKYKNEEE